MACTLPDNILQEIEKLYQKNQEDLQKDVEIIKRWFESQPHLPEIMDDKKILNFLMLNKFSIEKTKHKIDMYYTMRSILPEMFINPKIKEMQEFLQNTVCVPHTKIYKNLYRVFISHLKKPNTSSPQLMGAHVVNLCEVRTNEDFAFGEIFFIDLTNYTLNDMTKWTLTDIAKIIKVYKEIYSLRLQRLCLFNCPSYITSMVGLLKMVFPPKIFARTEFHKDDACLKDFFTQEELPEDYGGKGPSLDTLTELLKKDFNKYKERFDELDSMKTDESRRPQPLKNDEILGFYGNFKKLNVD